MQLDGQHLVPAALLAAAEHDLRGLLVTLRGGADTLRRQLDGSPLEEVAGAVGRASEQLSVVLSDLVAAAGQLLDGGLADDIVDLGSLLGELTSSLGIEDVVSWPEEPLLVAVSGVALRHVLLNLLENAVAAGGAGAVDVWVRLSGPDWLEVTIRNPLAGEPAGTPSVPSILHTARGRGLQIVGVLAAATGMQHTAEVVEGDYVVRVRIRRRRWHPSLQQPESASGHVGQVTVLPEVARSGSAEQSR